MHFSSLHQGLTLSWAALTPARVYLSQYAVTIEQGAAHSLVKRNITSLWVYNVFKCILNSTLMK